MIYTRSINTRVHAEALSYMLPLKVFSITSLLPEIGERPQDTLTARLRKSIVLNLFTLVNIIKQETDTVQFPVV
jgi:hypothetical protein